MMGRSLRSIYFYVTLICFFISVLIFGIMFQNKPEPLVADHFHTQYNIPKYIHFIWVQPMLQQDKELPQEMISNIQEWKDKNPDFEVMIWTGKRVQYRFPELTKILRKIPIPAWMSNIIRYKISYEYGGLYLDTDIRALSPVSEILELFRTGFVVCERPRTNGLVENHCRSVCNAVIASNKNSPTMRSVFEESISKTEQLLETVDWNNFKYTPVFTGPGLLSEHILYKSPEIPVLGATTFYPCDWTEMPCIYDNYLVNKSHVYGMHLWKGSWE